MTSEAYLALLDCAVRAEEENRQLRQLLTAVLLAAMRTGYLRGIAEAELEEHAA